MLTFFVTPPPCWWAFFTVFSLHLTRISILFSRIPVPLETLRWHIVGALQMHQPWLSTLLLIREHDSEGADIYEVNEGVLRYYHGDRGKKTVEDRK